MSKVPDIVDMELLTPGSVWTSESGKQSRVLHVTNQHFTDKIKRVYPVQVIYADEIDRVNSVPLEDFLAKREFYNVDPGLESRLGELLAISEMNETEDFELGDEENLLVLEDEEINPFTDEPTAPTHPNGYPKTVAETVTDTTAYTVEFSSEGTGLLEVIAPNDLARAVQGYVQTPLIATNQIQHTLLVASDVGINADTLNRSFNPSQAEINAIYTFKVYTDEGVIDVNWDTFVGVFPMTRGQDTFYQLMFLTNQPMHEETPAPADMFSSPAPAIQEQVAVVASTQVAPQTVAAVVAEVTPPVQAPVVQQMAPVVQIQPQVQPQVTVSPQ